MTTQRCDAGFFVDPLAMRRVYHVTPAVLVPSIERRGVLKDFSNGPQKVSWWTEKSGLMWALSHISAIKAISVDQLSVFAAVIWKGALVNTQFPGVYKCAVDVEPRQVYPALEVFSWLNPNGSWKNG